MCEQPGSCYDHLQERRFEFVPLWGLAVYFVYTMRRVDCETCGVKVERIPLSAAIRNGTNLAEWSVPATRLPGEEIWARSCGNRESSSWLAYRAMGE